MSIFTFLRPVIFVYITIECRLCTNPVLPENISYLLLLDRMQQPFLIQDTIVHAAPHQRIYLLTNGNSRGVWNIIQQMAHPKSKVRGFI